MRTFLTAALKGNTALRFGVLTGVLRIAKESIFSALNNLEVSTVVKGNLEEMARLALAQIQEKDYLAEFRAQHVSEVWRYGVAFCGKKVRLAVQAANAIL